MRLPAPPRLRRLGAPPALPAVLDRVSERWWRLRPAIRAVLLGLVVVAALAVMGRGATRSPWGAPTSVLVTAEDLPGGALIGPGAVKRVDRPARLVPDDALTGIDQLPGDARARGPTIAGTVVTGRHLATGVVGLLARDEAAVAVPRGDLPAITAGSVVDVVATTPGGEGTRVARAARVLAVEAEWLWLGMPTGQVSAVAGASASGQLRLAVRGPADGRTSTGGP